jgi:hypothetical protein
MSNSSRTSIYQLKVTLKHSKPPIWRRLQVDGSTGLDHLHDILQAAMGWTNSHLHQFVAKGRYYGVPEPDWGLDVENEEMVRLCDIAPAEKSKFVYEYDSGDSWEHEILVEKIIPTTEILRHAVCITGKRACPPEDCGGVWGYEHLLEALKDPNHPDHGDLLDWVGVELDPEEFEVDEVNEYLVQLS